MKKILSALIASVFIFVMLTGTAFAWGGPAFDWEAFDDIFISRSINPHYDHSIGGPGEYGSVYACVLPDGIIDMHEFAGKSGEIYMHEMANTIFYPFAGVSSAERLSSENSIREFYAGIDAEKFVDR